MAKTNPKSPWRKKHGGLGPLSRKDEVENEGRDNLPGVLDREFFEAPERLTEKELDELIDR